MAFTELLRFFRTVQDSQQFHDPGELGSDTPILVSSQDLLRRTLYAQRIASILSERAPEEGRVFAMRGAWGAGKTSLKNLVGEELRVGSNRADWIDFNPWQWGDGDAIAKALFEQIANQIGGDLAKGSVKRAKILRQYGSLFTAGGHSLKRYAFNLPTISLFLANLSVFTLAAQIEWSSPRAATIAMALTAASIVSVLIGGIMKWFGRDVWAEPMQNIRESLERGLKSRERPLVVFVDDIDRLEPDQIRSLIRQIKVNANLPNIIFVLLFQPSIVEEALNPIANGQGREFLKKIVQANFDLPAVSQVLVHSIMTNELSRLVGEYATSDNGFDQVRWGNALIGGIQPYIENLRDARRFVSSVAIHLPLHAGDSVLEVNIIDFLLLEAVRVFEKDLHNAFISERNLLLQLNRFPSDNQNDNNKEFIRKLITVLPVERQKIAQNVIVELFPKTAWVFGGGHYGDDWADEWNSAKRVCTQRHFPRYFELQTPTGEISENDFSQFLEKSSDEEQLQRAIEDIENRQMLTSLVARLDESVKNLPIESATILLPAMFSIAEKLVAVDSSGFDSPWVHAWRAVSWYIDRIPEDLRGELTIQALKKTKALSVTSMIIHLNDSTSHDKGSQIQPKLDLQTVKVLKEEWLRQIRDLAESPSTLMKNSDLVSLLYRWRDYSGGFEEPRSWVNQNIRADDNLVLFLNSLITIRTSYTAGDKVSRSEEFIDLNSINDFVKLDTVTERLKQLSNPTDENSQRVIKALQKSLKRREKGLP